MGPTVTPETEARRLAKLPAAQARAQYGDRIARAFLLEGTNWEQFKDALHFNAILTTHLARLGATIWGK